jgi:hypothetical protein
MPSYPTRLTLVVAIALAAGCGQQQDAAEVAAGNASDASPATAEQPAKALPRTAAPEGARVYFIVPADGDTVTSPVDVEFGIEGMAVVPAGVEQAASGHHHLIVDAELPDPTLPIPKSDHYIHFGDGSTSTTLELEPGEHTLQLVLGDHLHIQHSPPVHSEVIRITVE